MREPDLPSPFNFAKGSGVAGEPPLLEIRNLKVLFKTFRGEFEAVRKANLSVMPGETVAIVGESGSGKSATALAALGLLPGNGLISGGQILLNGEDVTHASERRMIELRGNTVGMVPQDPISNLNPVWKVGYQVRETLRANGKPFSRADVARALSDAGLPDSARRAKQYPHEFSGGMCQRALIAIGLSCQPRLLIADEPTSALDVTVQRHILDHLELMTSELGTAVLLITHDLGVAADRADTIVVMYRGTVVESGPSLELLNTPRHPYTQRLVASTLSLASHRIRVGNGPGLKSAEAGNPSPSGHQETLGEDLLSVENLTKVYKLRSGIGRRRHSTAVDDVSFTVKRGTTTAIVGESGSGKTTIAKMLLGLVAPTSGRILFAGMDTSALNSRQIFAFRRRVQPVFQDPYGSLDPMFNVFRTVEEPLRVHRIGDPASRGRRVWELLDAVSLPRSIMHRYPRELSGGQRQRVAIARALALKPDLIICDEAVSALDVLVQAQILNLLADLQSHLGVTYLFISHDLAAVRQIADRVCVMDQGKFVETGTTGSVFGAPQHDYTKALLKAIPGALLRANLNQWSGVPD